MKSMVRLTEKNKTGFWQQRGVSWEKLQEGHKITKTVSEKIYGALCKLKDYEETGLRPDQVAEAAEKNIPLEPMLTLGITGITVYECKKCGNDVFETQNYCPYCGQRLKWEE